MQFRDVNPDSPILGLTESGEDMTLVVGFIGFVEYKRSQSEALAKHLEAAAKLVRNHA